MSSAVLSGFVNGLKRVVCSLCTANRVDQCQSVRQVRESKHQRRTWRGGGSPERGVSHDVLNDFCRNASRARVGHH